VGNHDPTQAERRIYALHRDPSIKSTMKRARTLLWLGLTLQAVSYTVTLQPGLNLFANDEMKSRHVF